MTIKSRAIEKKVNKRSADFAALGPKNAVFGPPNDVPKVAENIVVKKLFPVIFYCASFTPSGQLDV
jgi:hypothetical protein